MRRVLALLIAFGLASCDDGERAKDSPAQEGPAPDGGTDAAGAATDGGADPDAAAPEPEDAAPPAPDAAPQAPDGAAEPDFDEGHDQCGDLRALSKVFYGTREPTVLPLTPGQVLAVGSFDGCSGLLITPRWVLTAAHCGVRVGARYCMGPNPDRPNQCVRVSRVEFHPSADLSIVQLGSDPRDLLPEVTPVPILTEVMDRSWIGRTAEASGYGQTDRGEFNVRRFTAEPIVGVRRSTLSIDGQGRRGVCFGDSGGPAMVLASDGTVRVAGALSEGDGSCVGVDHFTRVDVNREWIEERTGPTVVEGAPCGPVGAEGRCLSGSAVWCADGTLQAARCEGDTICGWDAAVSSFRCVAPGGACDEVDGAGTCDREVARWCDDGQARARDCGACGLKCAVVPEAGGAVDCVPDPCEGLDYLGRCNGNVAEWCEDGQFQTQDCAEEGARCRWIDNRTGYFCG